MRVISFSETTNQIRNRTKTVTRRAGWLHLKPGDKLRAVVKAMGLRKGEHVEDLCTIEVVSVRREPVCAITPEDVVREGFPDWTPAQFVDLYRRINGCDADALCTRIEARRSTERSHFRTRLFLAAFLLTPADYPEVWRAITDPDTEVEVPDAS